MIERYHLSGLRGKPEPPRPRRVLYQQGVNNALLRPKAPEVGVGWSGRREEGTGGTGTEELGARGLWGLKAAQE